MSPPPPLIGTQSTKVSDTRVSNRSQFDGRSLVKISDIAIVNEPQIDKNQKTQPEMQPPALPAAKQIDATIDDNDLKRPSTEVSKELTVETSVKINVEIPKKLDARINSKTPTHPDVETPKKIDVETTKLDFETSTQLGIETLKELEGEASGSPNIETPKQPKSNKKLGTKSPKQLPGRRSARVSMAPTRYTDTAPSTYATPEAQKEQLSKATPVKESPEPKDSEVSLTLITHSINNREHSTHTKKALTIAFTPRGSGRLRKLQRDAEPSTEAEAPPLKPLRKKIKPNPKDLDTVTPKATIPKAATPKAGHKARGPTATRPTAHKTRSQSSLSTADVSMANSVEPPLTEVPNPAITRPKFNFARLNIETLRAFVEDAMHHYSRLPKNLTDPDGIGALYRTFFPTSTYQGYAKTLDLDVNDSDLREMMRMVWEMVNGGEDDAMVVSEKLGLAWTKGEGV